MIHMNDIIHLNPFLICLKTNYNMNLISVILIICKYAVGTYFVFNFIKRITSFFFYVTKQCNFFNKLNAI